MYINNRNYVTRCKCNVADIETTLRKAYVYQTGIMEAHCVLSTADSLSDCVNRPSCVRPAALWWNGKAHKTVHELHTVLHYSVHKPYILLRLTFPNGLS